MDDLYYVAPNEEVERLLATAKQAVVHLAKSWAYHLDVGRAVWEYKLQLERELPPPNDPDTPLESSQKYRDSMSEFLRRNGFHEDADPPIWTKAERSNLMKIMARLPEVEEFREWYGEKHGTDKLRRLNNPSHVWSKFLIWKGEKKQKEKPPRKQDETVRLVGLLDACCDALRVAKSPEYSELLDRVRKFDGSNFHGVPTEEQRAESAKWVTDNRRLSHDLQSANTGLIRALDEVDKLKDHRDKQATTLTAAIGLLQAFTTAKGDDLVGVLAQTEAFLKEHFPPKPWSDDWNQREEKKREERPTEPVANGHDSTAAESPAGLQARSAADDDDRPEISEFDIPEGDRLVCTTQGDRRWITWTDKYGKRHRVVGSLIERADAPDNTNPKLKHFEMPFLGHGWWSKGAALAPPKGETPTAAPASATPNGHANDTSDDDGTADRWINGEDTTLPEISEFDIPEGGRINDANGSKGVGEDKWYMHRTYTDENGQQYRIIETRKVVPYSQCYDPYVRPKLKHFHMVEKNGKWYKGEPLTETPPNGHDTTATPETPDAPEEASDRVQAAKDHIAGFLKLHPRVDRSQDEDMAKILQRELLEKNIATVGITLLKKMIADAAPLPRGRKAKVQEAAVPPEGVEPAAASEAAADPQEPPMANGNGAGGAEGPRFGQKRIVGLCIGTWYPLDLIDDLPGPVERYGIEVFRGTEANRDGEYVRVSKEFATRQEAESLMA